LCQVQLHTQIGDLLTVCGGRGFVLQIAPPEVRDLADRFRKMTAIRVYCIRCFRD